MVSISLTPHRMMFLFLGANFFNFLDRGIIPGAPIQFREFITDTMHGDENEYFGLLTSVFIVFYACSCLVFGHLVHHVKSLRLIGIGLGIWSVAVVICWLAYVNQSFYMLLAGRALTGCGEASFQCIAPAFINDHSPSNKRVLWMGIFFGIIPFGTAIGYMYGAWMSNAMNWGYAFLFEVIAMQPFFLLCLVAEPLLPEDDDEGDEEAKLESFREVSIVLSEPEDSSEVPYERFSDIDAPSPSLAPSTTVSTMNQTPSVLGQLRVVLGSIDFLFVTFGYAAYTAVVIGFSTYGPTFLVGMDFFENSPAGATNAATTFGAVIAIVGIVGTPLGGYLVDKSSGKCADDVTTLYVSTRHMLLCTLCGTPFVMAAAFMNEKWGFMLLLALGVFFLFSSTAAITIAILHSVPKYARTFAVALNTMMIHAFGDVPSPIVVGMLITYFDPSCKVSSEEDGEGSKGIHCDKEGLRTVMYSLALWLLWGVVCWGIAYILAVRKLNLSHKKRREYKSKNGRSPFDIDEYSNRQRQLGSVNGSGADTAINSHITDL